MPNMNAHGRPQPMPRHARPRLTPHASGEGSEPPMLVAPRSEPTLPTYFAAAPALTGRPPRRQAASHGHRSKRRAQEKANSTPPQRASASIDTWGSSSVQESATVISTLIEFELAGSTFRSARFFEDFIYAPDATTAHANRVLHGLCSASPLPCKGLSCQTPTDLTESYLCAPPDLSGEAFPHWFCYFATSIAALTTRPAATPLDPEPGTHKASSTTSYTKPTWIVTGHKALSGVHDDVRRPDFALSADSTFDWRHILIVGEHQSRGSSLETAFIKLGCYAEQVFIAQPFRAAVLGILTYRQALNFEVWRFDRAGALGSYELSYATGAGLRTLVLTLESMTTRAPELCDSMFQTAGVLWKHGEVPMDELSGVSAQVLPDLSVDFRELVFCAKGLVGRGTRVWKGIIQDPSKGEFPVQVAIKESWRSIGRDSEAELYHEAANRGVQGLPALIHHASYEDVQGGVRRNHTPIQCTTLSELGEPSDALVAAGQRYALQYATHMATHNRVFSRLVLEHSGVSIDTPELSALSIARALLAAAIGHASLFFQGGILHRDLSPYNILASDAPVTTLPPTTQTIPGLYGNQKTLYGCLIDLDYALDTRNPEAGSDANSRTGTYPFIAINVLRDHSHRYRHDLESLLYVLLYVALYPRPNTPPPFASRGRTWNPVDPLERWFVAEEEVVVCDKKLKIVICETDFQDLLLEFRPGFAPFRTAASEMRLILWRTTADGEHCECFGQEPNTIYNQITALFEFLKPIEAGD